MVAKWTEFLVTDASRIWSRKRLRMMIRVLEYITSLTARTEPCVHCGRKREQVERSAMELKSPSRREGRRFARHCERLKTFQFVTTGPAKARTTSTRSCRIWRMAHSFQAPRRLIQLPSHFNLLPKLDGTNSNREDCISMCRKLRSPRAGVHET